jgi:hypothetical protein
MGMNTAMTWVLMPISAEPSALSACSLTSQARQEVSSRITYAKNYTIFLISSSPDAMPRTTPTRIEQT